MAEKENINCLLICFTSSVVNLGRRKICQKCGICPGKPHITVSGEISFFLEGRGVGTVFGENSRDFHVYYDGKTRMNSVQYPRPRLY